ncbi:MAG TPA: hypothetical protein VGJ14_13750 [Sporichthyaceae bacterium]|jgi:hypothetical protein
MAVDPSTEQGKAAYSAAGHHKNGTIDGVHGHWKVVKTGHNTGDTCKQGYWHEAGVSVWDFHRTH